MRGLALILALVCTLLAAPAWAQVVPASVPATPRGNQRAVVGEGTALPVLFETVAEEPPAANETEAAAEANANEAGSGELPQRGASLSRMESPVSKGPGGALGTVIASLAIVIGLFLLVVWVSRRFAPRSSHLLPTEVLEVLGRAPLPGKQQMQLLRVGRKLVLVCTTPGGMETLTEVTDPEEVDRLSALCQQQAPGSVSGTFRQVLTNLNQEAPAKKARLGREARALARSHQQVFEGAGSSWEGGDA